jgi:transposase
VRYDEVRYPGDLSDERWELIRPVIEAWKAGHAWVSGHQGRYAMREMVNAILYQTRTGCQWRYLPRDLPPYGAVYYYFVLWRRDGTDKRIHDLLRMQVREAAGRAEDPSAVVLDSQSVRAAAGVPGTTTGLDAGKSPGRKRGLAVDVIGLIIAVVVMAASAHDNAIGSALLSRVAAENPSVTKAFVDAGSKDQVAIDGATPGDRRGSRLPPGRGERIPATAEKVGGRADAGHIDTAPTTGARLREESRLDRLARVLGRDREHDRPADRHPDYAVEMVMTSGPLTVPGLIDKLTARQAAAETQITHLREQVAKLTDALTAAEYERDRWASARESVLALATEDHPDPAALTRAPVTPAYRQIIATFTDATTPLRAKDACQALGVGTDPRHVEASRSKLKKLVARGILTEPEAGLFTLANTTTHSTD